MTGWLSPYRVLDMTDERGLLAGSMLARLGAEVIQLEPPEGSGGRFAAPLDVEGRSFYWSAFAAGKKSVVLDIASELGRAAFLRLVETADFLIETESPDHLARLGLDYDRLKLVRPQLVHVSITPFGRDGPKRHYADAELVLWAAGGPLHPNRDVEGPPLRISVPQAYLHGAADAAAGALIAHLARARSGRGQHVDVSVQQSVTQATIGSHLAAAVGHENFSILARPQGKMGKPTLDLSGSGSRTRRSKWIVRDGLIEMHLGMGPAIGDKTNNLFAWIREEGALPSRFQGWNWISVPDEIEAGTISEQDIEDARKAVANFLSGRSKAEIQAEAHRRKVLASPVNDVGDLLASEHFKSRGIFATVDEQGRSRTLPWAFAHGPTGMFAAPAPAPELGQHTAEILQPLGISAGEPR
jgi:crotonobetainyl-CoA:carnitine CoA-transferase CaiB-like acyl-CoA transferase